MRFILNILRGIKERCGKDFPVIARLTADECYSYIGEENKGYKLEDGIKAAKMLKKDGFAPIVIGDALKVGKIADATKAAYMAAISIH